MTDQITIPRETFDQMREALEAANIDNDEAYEDWKARRDAALSAAKAVDSHTSGDYALGYAEGFNDACKPAAKEVQPQAQGEDKLRETVATVLEGWTIPDAVRKMLETAYWSHPQASEPAAPEDTK